MWWLRLLLVCLPAAVNAQSWSDRDREYPPLTLDAYIPEKLRFAGPVRVIDGDTVDMQTRYVLDFAGKEWGGRTERLRLAAIDAPEAREPFGAAATERLRTYVEGAETLRCICMPANGANPGDGCLYDRYKRVIVKCGTDVAGTIRTEDVGREMVRHGLARARYGCDYAAEHRTACAAKIGLWADWRGDCEPRCDWR